MIPGIGEGPSDLEKALVETFHQHRRSARKLMGVLNRYAAAVEGLGAPRQATLFGDESPPTKEELWNIARALPNPEQSAPLAAAQKTAPQQEMAQIEARAKADGTWMKAPKGQPTNLTEEQWKQVRTQAFKEQFGDWEAIAEEAAWKQRVSDYFANPHQRQMLRVGRVPAVLRTVGVSDAPLMMPPSVIGKVTGGKHTLTPEIVEQIPAALRDPIFVFDSSTESNAITVLTEIKHNGRNVLAAIHLDRTVGRNGTGNLILSLHERPAFQVQGWIRDGLLRYSHQKKARTYFQSARLQLPREGSKAGNKNLLTEADIVNPTVNPDSVSTSVDENGEPANNGDFDPTNPSILKAAEKIIPFSRFREEAAQQYFQFHRAPAAKAAAGSRAIVRLNQASTTPYPPKTPRSPAAISPPRPQGLPQAQGHRAQNRQARPPAIPNPSARGTRPGPDLLRLCRQPCFKRPLHPRVGTLYSQLSTSSRESEVQPLLFAAKKTAEDAESRVQNQAIRAIFVKLHGPRNLPQITRKDGQSWRQLAHDASRFAAGEHRLREAQSEALRDQGATRREEAARLVDGAREERLLFDQLPLEWKTNEPNGRPTLDPRSGSPTWIRGARVSAQQVQGLSHGLTYRLRSALREGAPGTPAFDWDSAGLADRLAAAFRIRKLTPEQEQSIRSLPLADGGSEKKIHRPGFRACIPGGERSELAPCFPASPALLSLWPLLPCRSRLNPRLMRPRWCRRIRSR
ncbi:MAG: hypothetical protein KDK99_16555 [Verrucomicrobiales bacterium]|nr:hypothetical protein [Verrucomicrobiales bacterium]